MDKTDKNKMKKIVRVIAISLVVIVCAYLFVEIYITHNLTWQGVYESLELSDGATVVDGEVTVTVVDVGQGDCIVIRAGKSVVMIDAGDRSSKNQVLAYLDANGIDKIDLLVATHPHADHIGGMTAVMDHCEVGQVMITNIKKDIVPTNSIYIDFMTYLLENEVSTRSAVSNEKIALDKGKLTVLSAGNYDDINNSSIVMRFDYGSTSFLFTGDAEKPVEKDLLASGADVECDVLKAGHHGSRNGTTADFLDAAGPDCVVVTCGEGNSYNHPHKEFTERVDEAGARLIRSDYAGDIVFVSDGSKIMYVEPQQEAA